MLIYDKTFLKIIYIFCHSENDISLFNFRLESYDRNDNFGHQLVQAEQFNMNVPEQSGYKDINSETQVNCWNILF